MLYKGTQKEKDEFFDFLKGNGKDIIYNMYQTLCEDDGLSCPYKNSDFNIEILQRGGVNILKISLPSYNPDINDILRAYLLFAKRDNGFHMRRYFLIKRFKNGNTYILYVNPECKRLLGEELTEYIGDMEYEYWKLVYNYAKIVLFDV